MQQGTIAVGILGSYLAYRRLRKLNLMHRSAVFPDMTESETMARLSFVTSGGGGFVIYLMGGAQFRVCL